MHNTLSQIVKEALEVPCERFVETVEEATELLKNENGKVEAFEIVGRLVKIRPSDDAIVIGDLHGDLESLVQILQESNAIERVKARETILIFLGDYGDRGECSAEIYYITLKLKLAYPSRVVLMRGNHEQFWMQKGYELAPSPHDLPLQFQARFGETCTKAYASIRRLFEYLHVAALVEERYLMVHGGLPKQAFTLEDLAFADRSDVSPELLEGILWSDPNEAIENVSESPRGAGKLFGRKVTAEVLKRFGVNILIRGHEPCEEGFKINHDGRILTLFSRKGSPYFNACGAYLDVKLIEKFQNAEQLIPYIHKF